MKKSIKTELDCAAYKRDNYRCVDCGKTTGLEAHHIIQDVEELDNLITLCHACHKKMHDYSGCFKSGYDPRRRCHYSRNEMIVALKKASLLISGKPLARRKLYGLVGMKGDAVENRFNGWNKAKKIANIT